MSDKNSYSRHIIDRYKKEIKRDVIHYLRPYYMPYDDMYLLSDEKRFFYFPYLFSALFYDPSPDDIRFIENEANWITHYRADPFKVELIMDRSSIENCNADISKWKQSCDREHSFYLGCEMLLMYGSAHRNGHVREQCVRAFSEQPRILPFILFRLNDWVPSVRRAAREMLAEYLSLPDITKNVLDAMPYVEYIRRSERAHRDKEFSMDELDLTIMKLISESPDRLGQYHRECYNLFAIHPSPENRGLLLHFFKNEPDGELRCILEKLYLQTAEQPVSAEILERHFMNDSYEGVRRIAYQYRLQHEGVWEGFEELLFSSSRRIRKFAEKALKAENFNILGFCREHLPETILALSDVGTKEDIPLIRPYLSSHPCEAMIALARLGAPDADRIIFDNMHSDNSRLAKDAYRLAKSMKCFDTELLLDIIKGETDPKLQWRFTYLLTKDGIWNAMPHLIRLVRDAPKIRNDLLWLIKENTVRKVRIPRELNEKIQEALCYPRETGDMPYKVNNQIFDAMR